MNETSSVTRVAVKLPDSAPRPRPLVDLRRAVPQALKVRPIVGHQSPGRNDKCRCGSGKKWKRCCLAKTRGPRIEWRNGESGRECILVQPDGSIGPLEFRARPNGSESWVLIRGFDSPSDFAGRALHLGESWDVACIKGKDGKLYLDGRKVAENVESQLVGNG